jgi:hypothetical protein
MISTRKGGLAAASILAVLNACSSNPGEPESGTPLALPSSAPPTTTAEATPGPVTDVLTGGRYVFKPFPEEPSFTVVATGPDGWVGYPSWAMDGPAPVRADAPTGIGITFFWANGVYSDPCHWDRLGTGDAGQPGDVGLGPTVDDLVSALRANTFYSSSAPTPVTIDGYAGQELELQLPEEPDFATCDKDDPDDSGGHVFVFSGAGLYAQGQANRWHLYILDVDGRRLILVVLSYAGTPQADLDTAANIIDTLDIIS